MSIVSFFWSRPADIDWEQRFEQAAKYHREKSLRTGMLAFVENWYYGYYALKQMDRIARDALKKRVFAQWKALKVCNQVLEAFWPGETTQPKQGPNKDGQL